MSAGAAPRLTRAIAEATQPYGPLDASHGLHALEARAENLGRTRCTSYAASEPF